MCCLFAAFQSLRVGCLVVLRVWWLEHWLVGWSLAWLPSCFGGRSIGWLDGWLVGWLCACSVQSSQHTSGWRVFHSKQSTF